MNRSRDFVESVIEYLKDPEDAVAYLNAALEDDDRRVFLLALKDVAEAWGGMKKLSAKARLNRESLYRALSEKGNPELASLTAVLESMGLRLAVEIRDAGSKKSARRKTPKKKAARRGVNQPAGAR